MGCISARPSGKDSERPVLTSSTPVCSGGDKDIFSGKIKDKEVVVAIVRPGRSDERLWNEIRTFQALGKHPAIIDMVQAGKWDSRTYLVFETVKPIGYDLSRLRNQYSFLGQAVPSSLMARLTSNVIDALAYMHSKGYIHKDVKADNVLVTSDYTAKVIDMGIAQKKGAADQLRAPYLAPELCRGGPLGVEVDCWGVGVIIHQVYQSGKWRLLQCGNGEAVKLMSGMPCEKNPMDAPVKEAMSNLLKLKATERWTLDKLRKCQWLENAQRLNSTRSWAEMDVSSSYPSDARESVRKNLRRYACKEPPPPALAAHIGKGNIFIGKAIGGMGLHSLYNATVLLVEHNGNFVKVPGPNTEFVQGAWFYFGVGTEQGEGMDKAAEGLHNALFPSPELTDHSASPGGRLGHAGEEGSIVAFTLEFDCFVFPPHVGQKAMIGRATPDTDLGDSYALDLRHSFNINLVGIQRIGSSEVEWYPKASAVVSAGDLGLIVRQPSKSGSSLPIAQDEDLAPLLDEEVFKQRIAKS